MAAIEAAANHIPNEQQVFLSQMPARTGERRLALTIMLGSLALFLALVPFAKTQLPQIDAFIPLNQSALIVNDLITAVILYGQFTIVRSRAVLLLATAYLFTALMMVPHTMTFPDLFSPDGLLGAGPQTSAWMYAFWHGGFPALVIGYVLAGDSKVAGNANRSVIWSVAITALAVIGLTVLATAGCVLLPEIIAGTRYTPAMFVVVAIIWLLGLTALTALLLRRQQMSALDLWLVVVVGAWLLDLALAALLNSGRFDLGFYAGRVYGLIAATTMLLVLLLETRALYARHARELQVANQALRKSEERLQHLNETLELRVQERSRQLEAETVERERMQTTLREVQKLEAIGRITGGIAHDFNNLLSVVFNYAEVLQQQLDGKPELKSVQAIKRAAERGARLVRQLKIFSRHQPAKTEVVDLAARSKELSELLDQSLRGDIRLLMDVDAGVWPVRCDSDELTLALINLCVNARDAMPGGGQVRIEARNIVLGPEHMPDLPLAGDFVKLTVADTGVGIAPEDLPKVFDPFFTTKPIGVGTGLGLSQVYGFAKQAGGHATVASAPQKGTAVALYLPRIGGQPARAVAQPKVPSPVGN